MFIAWFTVWFILDSSSLGMYKEMKYSLVKSLYFAHEDSKGQILKDYTQIYPQILTKFGRASYQSIVLSFT